MMMRPVSQSVSQSYRKKRSSSSVFTHSPSVSSHPLLACTLRLRPASPSKSKIHSFVHIIIHSQPRGLADGPASSQPVVTHIAGSWIRNPTQYMYVCNG